jgi:hypothetical protein
MDSLIKEIKRRLKKEGCGHLRVRSGRGTSGRWIEIHRPNPGEMLSIKEEEAIAGAFGEKHESGRSNAYSILDAVAEMKLGLREKKPVCEACGCIFKKEEHARACLMSH